MSDDGVAHINYKRGVPFLMGENIETFLVIRL
jgi:hypothetical protein